MLKNFCDGSFTPPKFPGGRLIEPTIDIRLLRSWVSRCTDQHGISCSQPYWSPQDEKAPSFLRLIDVHSRCIEDAPENCSYYALSMQVQISLSYLNVLQVLAHLNSFSLQISHKLCHVSNSSFSDTDYKTVQVMSGVRTTETTTSIR